jgi:hypothetical protein
MTDLAKLLSPGLIGTYTHFEATEIFVNRGKNAVAENVLTILVAEDRSEAGDKEPVYLGGRIKLQALDDWNFGIKRYAKPISGLTGAIGELLKTNVWSGSGEPLRFGPLEEVSVQFVPPDSTKPVPWNRVLRSNLWNGSHVVEWSDKKKNALDVLFQTPRLLQELAGKVLERVPIDLAGLSDRLGNLVVQLPVTALMSKFAPLRTGEWLVSIAWHPNVEPRALRAVCFSEFDGITEGFVSAPVQSPETKVVVADSNGLNRAFLWDDLNNVLLAALGPTGILTSASVNMMTADTEPRTVKYLAPDGNTVCFRVGLSEGRRFTVGDISGDAADGRTRKRIYTEQEDALKRDKVFLQYQPDIDGQQKTRDQAIGDVRSLINRYGQFGAWLWDPYLNSYDTLNTLFWSMRWGADLRALTAAREPLACEQVDGEANENTRKENFVNRQREVLEGVEGNWRGFRFEFRARHGQAGWGFHDRFLIFPQRGEAALAWSLGTSVNSLGSEHHIIQKVTDGQLVKDAFERLWEELADPAYLIWKKP